MIRGKLRMLGWLALAITLLPGTQAVASSRGGSLETLKQYVSELKKRPDNVELRERVIKYARSMRQKPSVPEDFERLMARGNAYLKLASESPASTAADYKKAVTEFASAVEVAPWLPEGYENLAAAQEKAGMFAEAIQSLNFTLLADPEAKNARELRNRTYELEVYAEDSKQALKKSPTVPLPAPPPPTVAKIAPAHRKPEARQKKTNPKVFVGNWFYKDVAPRGGEQLTTQAFTITMGADGKLAASAPRRSTGAIGKVTEFEIDENRVKLEITWKLVNIPTYWKSEGYNLHLTGDETKLQGSFRIKSSGRRDFSEDMVLFKQ